MRDRDRSDEDSSQANFIAKAAERRPGSYPAQLAQVCNLGALSQAALEAILGTTYVG